MENLKVGGVFPSRTTFTSARKIWSVGSFGDGNKFMETRNSGRTVDYKCRTCGKDKASPVNIRITIGRKKKNGVSTARGAPVTITDWNPCHCVITEAPKKLSLPSLGQIFKKREDFKKHMRDYCEDNRKRTFRRVENGNNAVETCWTNGCHGKVVVSLVSQKTPTGGHKWVPPLTVVEVQPCIRGCQEMGGRIKQCILCSEDLPAWEFVRIIGVCHCNGDYCHPCLTKYCKSRPLHQPKTKVVHVGKEPGEIQYVCPVSKCLWSDDNYFYKGKTHPLMDLFPCGFDGEVPVATQVEYDLIYQQHLADKKSGVYTSDNDDDDDDAILDILHGDLVEAEGHSATLRNLRRIQLLVHQWECTEVVAKTYILEHHFWEQETGNSTEVIEILD